MSTEQQSLVSYLSTLVGDENLRPKHIELKVLSRYTAMQAFDNEGGKCLRNKYRLSLRVGANEFEFDYTNGAFSPNSNVVPSWGGYYTKNGMKLQTEQAFREGWVNASAPSLADVVYSLAMDASSGAETFEDFCANCGYDTDSRKALETYLACQKHHAAMVRLFGRETLANIQACEY